MSDDIIVISDEGDSGREDEESTLDPGEEDDQLTKVGSVSSALGQLTNTGSSDWTPWVVKGREEVAKPQRDFSEIVDGRFVYCWKHNKKRHKDRMNRVSDDSSGAFKFECPEDAKCFVDVPKVQTANDKRYYGSMREIVARRRSFKKVCWECGIGEHERQDCPNRIDPSTCELVGGIQPVRYSMDYIRGWSYRNHLLPENDVLQSLCCICDRPGSVNCCSKSFASPPCCSKCCTRGHTQDECASNYNTNYHTRPDSFRGRVTPPPAQQPQVLRPKAPPTSVRLPPPIGRPIITSVRLCSRVMQAMPKDPDVQEIERSGSDSWGRSNSYGNANSGYDYRNRNDSYGRGSDTYRRPESYGRGNNSYGRNVGGNYHRSDDYGQRPSRGRGAPQTYSQPYHPYQYNDRRGGRGNGRGYNRY